MPTTPDLRGLADRLAIDDLLTRYAAAIDARDWDALDAVFTPDATIDYTAAGGIRGRYPEVKAWLAGALGGYAMSQHYVTNRTVRVDGDTATSRAYVYNPMGKRLADGSLDLFFMGGAYRDRLVRTPDGWRIVERIEEVAWIDRRPRPA